MHSLERVYICKKIYTEYSKEIYSRFVNKYSGEKSKIIFKH